MHGPWLSCVQVLCVCLAANPGYVQVLKYPCPVPTSTNVTFCWLILVSTGVENRGTRWIPYPNRRSHARCVMVDYYKAYTKACAHKIHVRGASQLFPFWRFILLLKEWVQMEGKRLGSLAYIVNTSPREAEAGGAL